MSEHELEPLPDPIEKLLAAERPIPAETAVSSAEVWRAIEGRVSAPPPAPGLGGLAASKLTIAVVAFAAGGALTALLLRPELVRLPMPQVVIVEAPARALPVPAPAPPPPEAAPPLPVKKSEPRPAPRSPDDELAAERALVEVARTALARKKFADADAALREHEQTHPRGRLSEERDGLWIQLAVAQGQPAEAHERLDRFERAYPQSILVPALEEALGEKQ